MSSETDSTSGQEALLPDRAGPHRRRRAWRGPAPWEQMAAGAPAGAHALRHAVARLMPVIGQVGATGGPREHEEAVKVLEEARRRLYAILAGDQAPSGHQ